jgi:chromosomal replication initiation ATPase DnaA
MKEDERILGDGDFAENVLKEAQESMERKNRLRAKGYDFDWLVNHVAQLLDMETRDGLACGKFRQIVKARSLLCYWATRELGVTTVELVERLHLAQPTVSQSAARGRKIMLEEGLELLQ